MSISEFLENMKYLEKESIWTTVRSFGKSFKTQEVDLSSFLNHLSTLDKWRSHVTDKKCAFMRLLYIDKLFVYKHANDEMFVNLNNLKIFALLMCCG